MKNKRNFIISGILIFVSIIFTILIKFIDVKSIGVNGSSVGFSTINNFFHKLIGVNMIFYHITDWLGFIPIFIAVGYAVIGIIQLIKRKSLLKIDKEIIALGVFYVVVVGIYVFFELVVVNYRPVLIDGSLEASYPSSHTLMAICLCASAIIVNKKLFNNKPAKAVNILSFVMIVVIVVGRIISGVHWFTDILGGMIISASLLMTLYSVVCLIKKDDNSKKDTLQE